MRVRRLCAALLCVCACVGGHGLMARAQSSGAVKVSTADLTWSTEAVEPQRFVAAHGRRALVMGYPEIGLEVWAYPLQLLRGYRTSFREQGETFAVPGERLLRRVEYRPDEIVRTYVGPDYVVRETMFVPLDEPGALITYEVEGQAKVDIEARFVPVLNLMWPGALGGQSTNWDEKIGGYVVSEPLHGYAAVIASPETSSHDSTVNRTIQQSGSEGLMLRPATAANGSRSATVYVGFDPAGADAAAQLVTKLRAEAQAMHRDAVAHYGALLGGALQIETPDAEVNRALAWTAVALDQAWACNPAIGCGELAGYGPSRGERRPQYAWFFAGDGLVATEALIAAGEFDRAREELSFIAKYQDEKTGMIWHEISQAMPVEQWRREYPYMFVHVDISLQYLATMADFLESSGDTKFGAEHWASIQAAYTYCESLIDASTGLPKIPAGREGANEQARMSDDTGLSSAWIAASEAYASMAQRLGTAAEAKRASEAAQKAKSAMAASDWDAVHGWWLEGHTVSGEPVNSQRPRPTALLSQHVFTDEQISRVLDQMASPDFETDWGVRSMSAASSAFDPNSYARGSVSALGSAAVAESFWAQHRSVTALQVWHALLRWNTLDSEGHMHEVLAGDFYHPEIESVPEQTWSSAGYLSATVRGLLGLRADAAARRLTFAPHLPPAWNRVAVRNIRVGDSIMDAVLTREDGALQLVLENHGAPVQVTFSPEVPLGASLEDAVVKSGSGKGSRVHAALQRNVQDEHALVSFEAKAGTTGCSLGYRGGVLVEVPSKRPSVGAGSRDVRVETVRLKGNVLEITASVKPGEDHAVSLRTAWIPQVGEHARIRAEGPGMYAVELVPDDAAKVDEGTGYLKVRGVVRFASR